MRYNVIRLLFSSAYFISVHFILLTFNTYIIYLICNNNILFFPDKFKLAIVKPLFKSESSEDVSNHGPISMLYDVPTIFEKIVKGRIIYIVEQNEL